MGIFIAGDLRLCHDGHEVEYATERGRYVSPYDVESGGDMKSNAEYIILVVGSHGAYFQLTQDKVCLRFPCLIVYTSDPEPDEDTVSFVRKIKEELDLPVLAFAESSPQAVKNLSLFVAGGCDIKWLGLRPSDVVALNMHPTCMLHMNNKDLKLAQHLLEQDAVVKGNPLWVEELTLVVKTRRKVEVEALYSLEPRFGFEELKQMVETGRKVDVDALLSSGGVMDFLSNVYFPKKMEEKDWI